MFICSRVAVEEQALQGSVAPGLPLPVQLWDCGQRGRSCAVTRGRGLVPRSGVWLVSASLCRVMGDTVSFFPSRTFVEDLTMGKGKD